MTMFSRPAAWNYVPVQFSSCSLRVFNKTLIVGEVVCVNSYFVFINISNLLYVCFVLTAILCLSIFLISYMFVLC